MTIDLETKTRQEKFITNGISSAIATIYPASGIVGLLCVSSLLGTTGFPVTDFHYAFWLGFISFFTDVIVIAFLFFQEDRNFPLYWSAVCLGLGIAVWTCAFGLFIFARLA